MIADILAFHFIRPLWLLMLLPAIILYFLAYRDSGARRTWRSVIDPVLLEHLLTGERRSIITPNAMLPVVWILATIAVAGPTWKLEPSPFADNKPPIMALIKVTSSMQTTDLAPTRLDRARQKLSDLLAIREGAATGLLAYAGSSHLVLPPTQDKDIVISMAGALSPEIMPADGDSLAAAITMADDILAQGGHGGSIIIFADTVADTQIAALASLKPKHALVIYGLLPANADMSNLRSASRALDADIVAANIDQADVRKLDALINDQQQAAAVAGEGQYWVEYGYWLTPLLALLVLAWFRRGWVLT